MACLKGKYAKKWTRRKTAFLCKQNSHACNIMWYCRKILASSWNPWHAYCIFIVIFPRYFSIISFSLMSVDLFSFYFTNAKRKRASMCALRDTFDILLRMEFNKTYFILCFLFLCTDWQREHTKQKATIKWLPEDKNNK